MAQEAPEVLRRLGLCLRRALLLLHPRPLQLRSQSSVSRLRRLVMYYFDISRMHRYFEDVVGWRSVLFVLVCACERIWVHVFSWVSKCADWDVCILEGQSQSARAKMLLAIKARALWPTKMANSNACNDLLVYGSKRGISMRAHSVLCSVFSNANNTHKRSSAHSRCIRTKTHRAGDCGVPSGWIRKVLNLLALLVQKCNYWRRGQSDFSKVSIPPNRC